MDTAAWGIATLLKMTYPFYNDRIVHRASVIKFFVIFRLIIDRTSILNKMENDLLPLKIRVNRLHDDVTKSVTPSTTGEDDPGEETPEPRRETSPDSNTNVFSKEIHNMLAKLSKMEFTIRHLIELNEQYSQGRYSV